jgi:hypothetical protein
MDQKIPKKDQNGSKDTNKDQNGSKGTKERSKWIKYGALHRFSRKIANFQANFQEIWPTVVLNRISG